MYTRSISSKGTARETGPKPLSRNDCVIGVLQYVFCVLACAFISNVMGFLVLDFVFDIASHGFDGE